MNVDGATSDYDERCVSIRRIIPARAEKLFDAWTKPELLTLWWGPKGVECLGAEIDLRVGGHYSIGNKMEDGSVIQISGYFEVIERPTKLVYTWCLNPDLPEFERVHVFFESREEATEIVIVHERVPSQELLDSHKKGWEECLQGLILFTA